MKKRTSRTVPANARGIIMIAAEDRDRLGYLLRRAAEHDGTWARCYSDLAAELQRANVLPRSRIPEDVVTMNSTVRLRHLETGELETYTLVYPEDANIEADRLSVLAPVGTALLGYRTGDVIEWPVPAGVTRFRIEEVLNPAECAPT